MARSVRNIEEWEAALIKAMLEDGSFTGEQIISYFSRPDRTVSPFRVAEIKKGQLFPGTPPANTEQVKIYVQNFKCPEKAHQLFFQENPLHPANLNWLFRLRDSPPPALEISETDRVECKENLNFKNIAEYARVIASLSNACGGFLIFGVRDVGKVIVGIQPGKLEKYDPAKLSQFLSEHFTPVPVWEATEISRGDCTIGLIYVRPSQDRPVICTKSASDNLREADIYYRYPGETRRIRYAELIKILSERSDQRERQWSHILNKVSRAGVENVAILDTATGKVSGHTGQFFIDQDLIPKLKFVSEGHFSETSGEPTLRLIGNLAPASVQEIQKPQIVVEKISLGDDDIMEDFVKRSQVADPIMYLRWAVQSHKIWLPLFFYARQAGFDSNRLTSFLEAERGSRKPHVNKLIKRIKNLSLPAGAPKPTNVERERDAVLSKTQGYPVDTDECVSLLKAIRTITPSELDADFVLNLMKRCFLSFYSEDRLRSQIQYALAHVDVIWQMRETSDVDR